MRLPEISFTIERGEGAGERRTLRPKPVTLEVVGLPPEERVGLDSIAGLLPPVAMSADPNRTLFLVAAIGLLAVAMGATAFVALRRRRRSPEARPLDPVAEARNALARLLASDWLARGLHGDFYVELTAIVRRYIERTTGVDAPDQTTEEFLRVMEHHTGFPMERRTALSAFLEAADLVKFAAQIPGEHEVAAAVAATRRFCDLETAAETPR